MKEKAVHPLPRNGCKGGLETAWKSVAERPPGGPDLPPHAAVSQRNDITFLVANEENVLDGCLFTR